RGETNLLHRAPLEYPAEAIAKGIQGTVVVSATLNERGIVSDARVLSGPEPLRKAALRSVLEWHYSGQAQSPVEVAIDFKLPAKRPGVSGTVPGGVIGGVVGGVPGGVIGSVPSVAAPAVPSGRLNRIQLAGVSSQLQEALEGRIPMRVGDQIDADTLSRVKQAVRDVDEHLDARLTPMAAADGGKEFVLSIVSTASMVTAASSETARRIRVGGNVQSTMVV